MRAKEFATFILAREVARMAKEDGKPRPWTLDPIIDKYRFCNVRREDDRVTKWLRNNWYKGSPFASSEDIWFAAIVARLLNLPDSLMAVRNTVLPFQEGHFVRALHNRKAQGKKNFNAAYIVSTNGRPMDKVEYIARCVLRPIWTKRAAIRASLKGVTLSQMHELLAQQNGLGSFMAAQVVADLKYVPPFTDAPDWDSFAASGPGSRRGLNRVMGFASGTPWRESIWRAKLAELREAVRPWLPRPLRNLHAQDIQNCLCEFDKYERVRLGEGEPKQIYRESH